MAISRMTIGVPIELFEIAATEAMLFHGFVGRFATNGR
jgi:hypothetical protein